MKRFRVSPLILALGAATRVLLGVGIGLLLSERMRGTRRVAAGRALAAVGAASTIPLAIGALRQARA